MSSSCPSNGNTTNTNTTMQQLSVNINGYTIEEIKKPEVIRPLKLIHCLCASLPAKQANSILAQVSKLLPLEQCELDFIRRIKKQDNNNELLLLVAPLVNQPQQQGEATSDINLQQALHDIVFKMFNNNNNNNSEDSIPQATRQQQHQAQQRQSLYDTLVHLPLSITQAPAYQADCEQDWNEWREKYWPLKSKNYTSIEQQKLQQHLQQQQKDKKQQQKSNKNKNKQQQAEEQQQQQHQSPSQLVIEDSYKIISNEEYLIMIEHVNDLLLLMKLKQQQAQQNKQNKTMRTPVIARIVSPPFITSDSTSSSSTVSNSGVKVVDHCFERCPLTMSPYHSNNNSIKDSEDVGGPLDHAVILAIDSVAQQTARKRRQLLLLEAEEHQNDSNENKRDTNVRPSSLHHLCNGYDLYTTHEPCCMCAMALVHSRIRRVIYVHDNRLFGGCGSTQHIHEQKYLTHHYRVFKVTPPQ